MADPLETRCSSGVLENWSASSHNVAAQPERTASVTGPGIQVDDHQVHASTWDETEAESPPEHASKPLRRTLSTKYRWLFVLVPLAIILVFVLLFPVVKAIVQGIVNKTTLNIETASISQATNGSFLLTLTGFVAHTGSISTTISFTQPVVISWVESPGNLTRLGTMQLKPLYAKTHRAVLNDTALFNIDDLDAFSRFTSTMMTAQNFTWHFQSDNLHAQALRFPVAKAIRFRNEVTLNGFNNFGANVVLKDFQLPSDNPVGGINFVASTDLVNPSHFSLELDTAVFALYYQGVYLGMGRSRNTKIATGTNQITLAGVLEPNSETTPRTNERQAPKPHSDADLARIGELFSNFLAGKNQTLVAKGAFVQLADSSSEDVAWLSTGFRDLSLEVTLLGRRWEIIEAIQLNDLMIKIRNQNEAFAPPTSSVSTLVRYRNPFGFSLQVVEAGQDLVLSAHGANIAQLTLPKSPVQAGVSTGNLADLVLQFVDRPLKALNEDAFQMMLAQVMLHDELEVTLKGTADVTARTRIGNIPISGVAFSVPSKLRGFNSFGGVVELVNVTIAGSGGEAATGSGGETFIVAPLTARLYNPSNISLETVDAALPVVYDGVRIGSAVVNNFTVVPGDNFIDTEFHYQPADANDTVAQAFLAEFLSTANEISLTMQGDEESTPFRSLQPALAELDLSSTLIGLNYTNLITQVNVSITLETLTTNFVSASFEVINPLDVPLIIEFVQSEGLLDNTVYSQFSQSFASDGFVVPPHEAKWSPVFDTVFLPQGAAATMAIMERGVLDVEGAMTVRVGVGGYQIPWLKLKQENVPVVYVMDTEGLVGEEG